MAVKARPENLEYERPLPVMGYSKSIRGSLALTERPIALMVDNQMKGISVTPAAGSAREYSH